MASYVLRRNGLIWSINAGQQLDESENPLPNQEYMEDAALAAELADTTKYPVDYRIERAAAYPPLADLAEAIVKQPTDGGAALDAYRAACLAVTAKYPKPEVT